MPFTKYFRNMALGNVGNNRLKAALKQMYPAVSTSYVTTTQTVNNSAVLVNSNELQLDVPSAGYYQIEGLLNVSIAAAANNIQFDLNGGTATVANLSNNFAFSASGSATTLSVDSAALNTAISGGAATVWTKVLVNMGFQCTVPGTIVLRFAQAVAAGNNTSLLAGSFLNSTQLDPSLYA